VIIGTDLEPGGPSIAGMICNSYRHWALIFIIFRPTVLDTLPCSSYWAFHHPLYQATAMCLCCSGAFARESAAIALACHTAVPAADPCWHEERASPPCSTPAARQHRTRRGWNVLPTSFHPTRRARASWCVAHESEKS